MPGESLVYHDVTNHFMTKHENGSTVQYKWNSEYLRDHLEQYGLVHDCPGCVLATTVG